MIGDTSSGLGAERRVHVLVKPTEPDLATNLLINTDRRTYYLELRASARTWQAQVSWRYPAQTAVLVDAPPAPAILDLSKVDRRYRIEGDHPPWRPVAVFDDGHRAYVEFGPDVVLDDLPPLYRLGVDGKSTEVINYRVEGRRIVVERLFDRAELRLGIKRQAQRCAADPPGIRRGGGAMSGERTEAEEAIAKTLRLRGSPAPVARLSRRALVIASTAIGLALFGAVSWSMLQHRRAAPERSETPAAATLPERVTALPRGYVGPAGVPTLGPPLPGDLGRPILAAQRAGAMEAGSTIPQVAPPAVAPVPTSGPRRSRA
ncbi:TrbG/VirB9 family P-type conjugative transfer protein [Caulobacter segnis]